MPRIFRTNRSSTRRRIAERSGISLPAVLLAVIGVVILVEVMVLVYQNVGGEQPAVAQNAQQPSGAPLDDEDALEGSSDESDEESLESETKPTAGETSQPGDKTAAASKEPTAKSPAEIPPLPALPTAEKKSETPPAAGPKPPEAKPAETVAAKKPDPPATKPPAPEPKKAAPPKPPDPFREFEAPFELPAITAGSAPSEPAVMAKLDLKEGMNVSLALLGGDVVATPAQFKLGSSSTSGAARRWPVQFVDKDGQSTVAGEFSLQDNQLMFAWKVGADHDDAEGLRNCVLQVSVNNLAKAAPLRKPIQVEPLTVKIDMKGSETMVRLENPPTDASILHLEITKLSETFPKPTYEPSQKISANKETEIKLADDKGNKLPMTFEVEFSRRGDNVKVSALPMIPQPPPKKGTVPMNPKLFASQLARMKQERMARDTNWPQVEKMIANNPKKAELQTQYVQESDRMQAMINQLDALYVLCENLHEKGQIEFRVFAQVGQHEVDLARTTGSALPVAQK